MTQLFYFLTGFFIGGIVAAVVLFIAFLGSKTLEKIIDDIKGLTGRVDYVQQNQKIQDGKLRVLEEIVATRVPLHNNTPADFYEGRVAK